jgi:hypothetical protein
MTAGLSRAQAIICYNPPAASSSFVQHFQFDRRCEAGPRKDSAWRVGQIRSIFSRNPPRQEGRIAIVTKREAGCDGRGRHQWTTGADADGEVVWSWRPDAGAKLVERSADDGGKKARFTGESAK